MGTRGAMGVRIDGADKITYNHCDSYPSGLGASMVADIKRLLTDPGLDGMREQARALRVIGKGDVPTAEDVERFRPVTDLRVSGKSETDWYCLTRELQGELAKTLHYGALIGGADFMTDSLFCEYAYIVNLDESLFEVYRGFQKRKHSKGRYADMPQQEGSKDYWPVALVTSFPLDAIPDDWERRAFPPKDEDE